MIYKILFGFEGNNQGWAETHSMLNGDPNPNNLKPTLRDIAQKRANMLGAPFAINTIRIAKFYDEIAGARARGAALVKETFTSSNPGLTGPAEPADVALIAVGQPNVTDPAKARFNGNRNQTFIGAPPDDSVTQGGNVLLGAAGLGAAFGSWRSAVIAANLGWLAVDRADDVPIDAIDQLTDGTVSITLKRAIIPAFVAGQLRTIRVRGVNGGRTPIPGQLLGYFSNNTTFISADIIGIPTPQIGGNIRVYTTVPVHLSYLAIELNLRTGQHDRGRPFGSPRGRQRRRVRG